MTTSLHAILNRCRLTYLKTGIAHAGYVIAVEGIVSE